MSGGEAEARAWLVEVLGADSTALDRLAALVDLLAAENEHQNLVSRGTLEHVWQRHILDSAQLLSVPRETLPSGAWLDLGTGAGFPGLVIAALEPGREVTMVDSRRLRTEWLERTARELGLANARIVLSKVEDLPAAKFRVISARAFAPLEKLLRISARFSTPDTLWLLPKGAKARHEVDMLPKNLRHTFHVEQSLTDAGAGIIAGQLLAAAEPTRPRVQSKRKASR